MSDNMIQLNQELIHNELKDLVRNSVEETLNALLDEDGYLTNQEEGHGWGGKSVQAFARENDGELLYRAENGIFSARLLI